MTKCSWGSYFVLLTGFLLFSEPLPAATYYSGTGFFISRTGQIVTNAHVVENCVTTEIRLTNGRLYPADIAARDEAMDLALLTTTLHPERPARLRHSFTGVQLRERVMTLGYPKETGIDGKYKVSYSTVRELKGYNGTAGWLQFDESIPFGNSGGPLLDYAANVVGVVTAKGTLLRYNELAARDEVISRADFAINLDNLRNFLNRNRVLYESRDSLLRLTPQQVESTAREFVVHVLCLQP